MKIEFDFVVYQFRVDGFIWTVRFGRAEHGKWNEVHIDWPDGKRVVAINPVVRPSVTLAQRYVESTVHRQSGQSPADRVF